MKKTLLIFVIILALLLALPVINLLRWTFQPKKPMDIILLDKTVPTLERENHRAISWILNNERYVDKQKKANYSYLRDYFGWHPLRPLRDHEYEIHDYRLTEIINMADSNDAIYIADTYGVFFNDWYKGINKSRRSRMLYGGLNNTDYLLLKEMKDRNRLIILEYNAFDYPTTAFNAFRIQEKLGIKFNGWTGRYFSSLDTTGKDFPVWMTQMYRKEHKKPWTFTKSGIVLVNLKNIIVLEQGTHLTDPMPLIETDTANCKKLGVIPSVAFDNWFDIVEPTGCNVLSNYRLQTTAAGDTLLMDYNLGNVFPAVIQEAVTPSVYYFAGNFAYSDKPVWTAKFKGVEKFKNFFYSEKEDDPRRFFWLYYKPLVSSILDDYYHSHSGKVTAKDK
ncbi:MAG TPA: hypothetical protein VK155_13185 [Bacteroidales bacterium]|jgi:hypothetical protein|nr:hypothetical protein [Bacteroidales bacterium]